MTSAYPARGYSQAAAWTRTGRRLSARDGSRWRSPAGDYPAGGKGTGRDMAGSDAKDRIIYPLEKRVVNPIVLLAWDLGFPTPGDALLETTGRRTGQPRRTPVCDGLDGDTFWLVAQRGHGADWVRTIAPNPPAPVKFRSGSRVGWPAP